MNETNAIATFVRTRRKQLGLTQQDVADQSGISIDVVRNLEQGIGTQRVATVNQLLALFGHELAPVPKSKEVVGA